MTKGDIRSACDILFFPGQVVEVRALGDTGTGTFSGYYDDFDKLAADAETLDSTPQFKGIYVTLNPVNPALLARKVNRVSRQGKTDASTSDQDITHRVWFPIDIDPTRPAGISSSNREHEDALLKATKIKGFLSEMGWPTPVLADSGNGAHLLYRIDLQNDQESTQLVKDCLTTLSQFFTDEKSSVDTANHNASRIWKLYGTVSRKGDHTEDRPHRRSKILNCPDEIQTVPVSELLHLASLVLSNTNHTHPTGRGNTTSNTYPTIDLSEWLLSHGLTYQEKPYSGGQLYILDECPFSSAHKDGAYCIQFTNGAIFAGCHHNSCGSGSQRWPELRERFEGGSEGAASRRPSQMSADEYQEKQKRDARKKAQKKAEYYGNEAESDQFVDANKSIAIEATRILREGDPLRYMMDTFGLDHEGDEVVAECLVMSLASRSVINSKGLHVLVTGESGKGKSHAFDTMLQQVPDELRLDGRMSDKALFYVDGLRSGSVIALDDISLSDQMQEILKGVTTSFQKPFRYRTVNKDRKGQTCTIPERCVWWVAKMEGTGDDQVWNRMLTCWIDDSEEQDTRVLARELTAVTALPEDAVVRPEIQTIQQIWRSLPPVYVVIPFGDKIRFSSAENRRNPGMLLDLIKSHAVLMQNQRERITHNGIPCIYATMDDFRSACKLFQALNGKSGGQMSKLTRNESELITAIRGCGRKEITISDMQNFTGKSYSSIQKMLHGYLSRGNHYSGLLEKCPAISFTDRTDVTDGGDTSRRNRVYTWNRHIDDIWSAGGGCWLDGYEPDDESRRNGGNGQQPAEKFRRVKNENKGSETHNNDNNNKKFLENTSRRKDEGASKDEHTHIHNPPSSAESVQPLPPGSPTPAISQMQDNNPGRNIPPNAADTSDFPPDRIPLEMIDPGAYHKIDGVWSGTCAVCGNKWVQYVERFNPDMQREKRNSRKICQKCYNRAVARETLTFRVLPGVINLAGMTRTNTEYGRCPVCGLQGITWWDDVAKTGLCDTCYSRESGGGLNVSKNRPTLSG